MKIDNDIIWKDVKDRGRTLSKKSIERIRVENKFPGYPEIVYFLIDALEDLNPDGLDVVRDIISIEGRHEETEQLEMLQAASWIGATWNACGYPTFRLSPGLAHGLMGTAVPDYDVKPAFPTFRIIFPEDFMPLCDDGNPERGVAPGRAGSIIFSETGYPISIVKHMMTMAWNLRDDYPPEEAYTEPLKDVTDENPAMLVDARMDKNGVASQGFRCVSVSKSAFADGGFKDDSEILVNESKNKTLYSVSGVNGLITIVKNLNAYLAMRPEDWPMRPRLPKKKRKPGRSRSDEMVWTVGKEIELPEHLIRKQQGEPRSSREGRSLSKRIYVPGHFRRQAIGKGWKDHKTIWIQPHYKGPEDMPVAEKRYHAKTLEEAGLTDA